MSWNSDPVIFFSANSGAYSARSSAVIKSTTSFTSHDFISFPWKGYDGDDLPVDLFNPWLDGDLLCEIEGARVDLESDKEGTRVVEREEVEEEEVREGGVDKDMVLPPPFDGDGLNSLFLSIMRLMCPNLITPIASKSECSIVENCLPVTLFFWKRGAISARPIASSHCTRSDVVHSEISKIEMNRGNRKTNKDEKRVRKMDRGRKE